MGSGGLATAFSLAPGLAFGGADVEITMSGRKDGSKVWFDPVGILVEPGQTIRWTNKDKGNAHTATAYHPDNFDRPRRIPEGGAAFDSDFLMPGESYEVTLTQAGVYDYYCLPHEMAGMVGRIVVAAPGQTGFLAGFQGYDAGDLPQAALEAFPKIADILAHGKLRYEEG